MPVMPLRCTQKLRCELLQNSPSQRPEVQRNAPLQGDRRVLSHSPGTLEEVHHLQTSEPQGQVVLCISRNAMEQAEKPASPSTCRTGRPGDSEVQKHAPLQGDRCVLSHSPGTLAEEHLAKTSESPRTRCSAHFEIRNRECRKFQTIPKFTTSWQACAQSTSTETPPGMPVMPLRCTQKLRCKLLQNSLSLRYEVQRKAPLQGDRRVLSHSPGTLEGEQVSRLQNPQGTCSAHFEIHSGESRNSRPLQSAPCHGRHVLRAPQQRLLLGCL